MPTYELKCQDCGKAFTLFCSWREKEQARCPECGSSHIQQDYRGVGILAGSRGSKQPARKFG